MVSTAAIRDLAPLAAAMGVGLDPDRIPFFVAFQDLLSRWNRRVNLVSDASPEVVVAAHFLDSLALVRVMPPRARTVVDVGAGAGFPSLPLAIARPGLSFTLVEPSRRKTVFLREAISLLRLRNAVVVERRVQELDPGPGFDLAVSRATLPPLQWLAAASRLVRPGGHAVLMAARPPEPSLLADAARLGLALVRADSFSLPVSGAPRVNTLLLRKA